MRPSGRDREKRRIAFDEVSDNCRQHRIVYFKCGKNIVWDKRSRYDAVFGSTPPFEQRALRRVETSDDDDDDDDARSDDADDADDDGFSQDAPKFTALQRYLADRSARSFDEVRALLCGPGFRCKVRAATLRTTDDASSSATPRNACATRVYLVMYAEPMLFASQSCAETSPPLAAAGSALDHCRGCVYERGTNRLLCHAFDKFWEHDDRRAADVAFEDPSSLQVSEKSDGLLVKLFFCARAWRVASNGCVDAFKARFLWGDGGPATTVGSLFVDAAEGSVVGGLAALYAALDVTRCYAFELLHPKARVVAPHASARLVHLGTRELPSGRATKIDDAALRLIGVRQPRELPPDFFHGGSPRESLVALVARLPAHREGLVVLDSHGRRVKIKGDAYLAAHRDPARARRAGFFALSRRLERPPPSFLAADAAELAFFARDDAALDRVLDLALQTLANHLETTLYTRRPRRRTFLSSLSERVYK